MIARFTGLFRLLFFMCPRFSIFRFNRRGKWPRLKGKLSGRGSVRRNMGGMSYTPRETCVWQAIAFYRFTTHFPNLYEYLRIPKVSGFYEGHVKCLYVAKIMQYICVSVHNFNSPQFLSRVSILTRDIDIANLSVCPSVCLSVCP